MRVFSDWIAENSSAVYLYKDNTEKNPCIMIKIMLRKYMYKDNTKGF